MNLDVAAEVLGVHYQTAYKWVRSGDLSAVKTGTRYTVSEAAITRFQARALSMFPEVESTDRSFRRTDPTRDDLLDALETLAMEPLLTVPSAAEYAAREGAKALGDMCFVIAMHEGCEHREYSAVGHRDPARAGVLRSMIDSPDPHSHTGGGTAFSGSSIDHVIRISHYPEVCNPGSIPPELRQYLRNFVVHGVLAAPIVASGAPLGVIGFTRDHPSALYTGPDEDFALLLGTRIGVLFETAHDIQRRMTDPSPSSDSSEPPSCGTDPTGT